MSRIKPEAQRRSPSPESRVSSPRENRAIHLQNAWASRGAWDFWVVRAFLIACTGAASYTLGPFGLRGLAAASVGVLIAGGVVPPGWRLRRAGLGGVPGGAVVAGACGSAAAAGPLCWSPRDQPPPTHDS